MGGKHKQGNRTKNNARPSSSRHSAELLGNTIPTFFGFSSIKDGVPAVTGFPVDNANYSINSDFQIMFKQMNKKDPTTRFKALQMFIELCRSSDVDAVKSILPLWPRMYCTLCTDIDHKVRESAHIAHRVVVSKVKKMIAPYLKELAGPWFTSQYDTYAPAASAATLAFEEAFPSTKLNKAIVFCQEEILSYIFDNLINQTPQTLSNPNTISPEDMQAKYERIIIASLQGYSLYLQKLSFDQIQEAEESNKKLLSNQKFWKYSKNKVPLIRSSFYHTLIALCQNAKSLLNGESARLSSAIFNNLDESDPIVLHAVWDAALNVLVTIEDCWSHINLEKQVFAKLSVVLKSGGRNVSTIYPNILPLLSKLPDEMIKDKKLFYGNLFDNMMCGLETCSYNQANSEIKIVANTFIECLKYTIMRNSTDVEFCNSLVTNHLIPALEQKLSASKAKKSTPTPFLTQTSCLVRYWYSNCSGNPTYGKVFDNFFLSLFTLYSNQLSSEVSRDALSDIIKNQVDFLCILLNPYKFLPQKKGHVKFEEEEVCPEDAATFIKLDLDDVNMTEEMLPFAKKLVVIYFKNAINNEDKSYIPAISKIVQLFDPKVIFDEMVIAVDESTCFKLFTSYFSKWLMNLDMKCGELVDLSFSLLKHVTNDEKEYILEEFCNNWFSDTLQFNVCKALPHYSEDDCIIKWVRSEKFATSFLRLAERFIEGEGEDMTSHDIIVMLMVAKCANGEFIINSNTSGSIMDLVSKVLSKDQVKPHVVELSQSLIMNANTEQIKESSVQELVASLFKLWCCRPEDESLNRACKTGLKIALGNCQKDGTQHHFTRKLSQVIGDITTSDKINFSPERIAANINTYIELSINTSLSDSSISHQEIGKAIEMLKVFLQRTPEEYEEGLKMVERCCRVGFEGNGELDFEYLKLENYLNISSGDTTSEWEKYPKFVLAVVKKYARWNLYLGNILNLIAGVHPRSHVTSAPNEGLKGCKTESDGEDEGMGLPCESDVIQTVKSEEDESALSDSDVIESITCEPECDENTIEPLLEEITRFLISVSLLESFNCFYAGTKHYKELKESTKKLKGLACDLLKNVNLLEFNFIYDHCRIFIRRQSLWWLVRPTLKEIFKRDFVVPETELKIINETDIAETAFEEIAKTEIKKQPLHRGNYMKLLGFIDKNFGHRFSEENWEEIFIYVHDFFEVFLPEPQFSDSDLLNLSALARLYYQLVKTFRENHTKPAALRIPPETWLAWNEVVQADVYNKFLLAWRKLAKQAYDKRDIPPEWIIVLQNVSDIVLAGISLRKSENLESSVDFEIEFGRLMMSSHAVIQITAFQLCLSVIPDLVKLDTEMFGNQVTQMFQDTKDSSSLFKKSSNGDWTIKNLSEDILHNQGIVETLLSDFIVGDCCTVEPFTDSFTYTYSYLLLWCFLLDMCGEAHSPLRFQYGCWLHEAGYSTTFLESVFKLMPQTVLHGLEAKENCRKYFESYGSLDFREPVESVRIEQIACFVYRLFLQRLPNVVREWWNQVENKTSGLVDKVTRLYVSPILITNELRSVQQDRETGFDNMEVKTYPNSREVVATYTIDEVKMDLIMTLPQNYPLGTIKIESSNVVVSTSNWRNWLFHICKYLIHQNGTIWDALVIWKNNLDKKFEGVEECYICFSILQGSTFEIPRLCCHTCKKKFHSNCLYKWFSSSNKSTCPICRNLF